MKGIKYLTLAKFLYICSSKNMIGAWRSWLAHLHGVQGVESSSLFAPTMKLSDLQMMKFESLFSFANNFTNFYRGYLFLGK